MPETAPSEVVMAKLLSPKASLFEVKPEHWISGEDADEGISFCRECAEAEIAKRGGELTIDGGYCGPNDSHAFCETCRCPLEVTLTDHGCEEELHYFEENGFDLTSAEDCYYLLLLFSSAYWGEGEVAERIRRLATAVVRAEEAGRG